MYCPNCGSEIQPGTKFCPSCGADVSAANAEQAGQTPQQPTNPTQPNGAPQQPYGTQPQQPYGTQPQQPYGAPANVPQGNGTQQPAGKGSGGKGNGKIIAIVAVVIVAVVAIGLFAFGAFSGDESDDGTEETTSQASTADEDEESQDEETDEEDTTSSESSTSSSASDAEPLSSEWLKDNFSEVWYGDSNNGAVGIYTNPEVTYVLVEFFDSDGSVSSYYYGDASYIVYDDNIVEVDIDVEQGDDVHFNYTLDGATMVLLDDDGNEAGRLEKQDFDSFVAQHS